jgi:hypothetical protein
MLSFGFGEAKQRSSYLHKNNIRIIHTKKLHVRGSPPIQDNRPLPRKKSRTNETGPTGGASFIQTTADLCIVAASHHICSCPIHLPTPSISPPTSKTMGFNLKEALAAKVGGGGSNKGSSTRSPAPQVVPPQTGGSKFGFSNPFVKTGSKNDAAPASSFEERTVPPTPSPKSDIGGPWKKSTMKGPVQDDFHNDDAQRGTKKSRGRTCLCVITLAVLGIAGYLTWKYALDEPTTWDEAKEGISGLDEKWDNMNFTNVLDSLDDFDFGKLFDSDPAKGDATARKWPEEYIDGGLKLTLLNALDDTWQSEFDDATSDWMESDALDLTIERVDVDHDCNRIAGVMVICNANFGATGWVGINQNEVKEGVIMSSVAKMNEYYLRNAEYDHRRFTMCHEIGHGE